MANTFKASTNQSSEVLSGFNPISRYAPNRVLATNDVGYAVETDVTSDDLSNFHSIVEGAQGIFLLDTLADL